MRKITSAEFEEGGFTTQEAVQDIRTHKRSGGCEDSNTNKNDFTVYQAFQHYLNSENHRTANKKS